MTKTNHINPVDFAPIAQAALRDDMTEATSKGRGRVRTLAALYVAAGNERMSNYALADVALIESKSEKGDTYKTVFKAVFAQSDSDDVKMTNSFKNKLKIALDVLAYAKRMERKHGVDMIRINEAGDVIRVRETLLSPDVMHADANWYSTDSKSKTRTSIDELARAARKHMLDETGEALPTTGNGEDNASRAGRKGKNDSDKSATTLHGLSLAEGLDLISGQIQVAQAKNDNKLSSDLKEAMLTLQAVIADAIHCDAEARKPASKRKVAA